MDLFTSILLVLGNADGKSHALKKAVALAKKNKARIRIVDVFSDEISPDILPALVRERASVLEELASGLGREGISARAEVLTGIPFIEIIRAVSKGGHDLVIKDAEGRPGIRERIFGSTDLHLFRKCPCRVWIYRPTARSRISSILAPVDPDPFNQERNRLNYSILHHAAIIAREEGARLYIVNAWDFFAENLLRVRNSLNFKDVDVMVRETHLQYKERLNSLLKECEYDLKGIDHEVHLLKGNAGDIIPVFARKSKVELIVMGTIARTGVPGFFVGNTAELILNRVNSSVLALKPEGFASPVPSL